MQPRFRNSNRKGMIITRSPFAICLAGDWTDLPAYYREHQGFVIAAAINKYVYITVHQTFVTDLLIKYSKLERVSRFEDIQHPIIRESFRLLGIQETNLEITSMSDIPAATGFGTSGSFTTALIKALHTYKKHLIQPGALADQACQIQVNKLSEPVGKHDQYVSAFGGAACLDFLPNDEVNLTPLKLDVETLENLEDNLVLFFTNSSHPVPEFANAEDLGRSQKDAEILNGLHFTKQLGFESRKALEVGDLPEFAKLLDSHWEHQKARTAEVNGSAIEECYEFAKSHGALGGKLAGAGESGFLLLYTEEKTKLRRALYSVGLREVRWQFDFQGTTVLSQS